MSILATFSNLNKCTIATYSRSGQPTKVTQRVHFNSSRKSQGNPGQHQKQQTSLPSIKVSVHDSTKRERLSKTDIYETVTRPKLLSNRNTQAHLIFEKKKNLLDDPRDFWTDKTKVKLLYKVCIHLHVA